MKENPPIKKPTSATEHPGPVGLDELLLRLQSLCPGADMEVLDARVLPWVEGDVVGEQAIPPEFFVDQDGQKVVLNGWGRIVQARDRAAKQEPGYSPDMVIEAVDVRGATRDELVARLLADGVIRNGLGFVEYARLEALLMDSGVPPEILGF